MFIQICYRATVIFNPVAAYSSVAVVCGRLIHVSSTNSRSIIIDRTGNQGFPNNPAVLKPVYGKNALPKSASEARTAKYGFHCGISPSTYRKLKKSIIVSSFACTEFANETPLINSAIWVLPTTFHIAQSAHVVYQNSSRQIDAQGMNMLMGLNLEETNKKREGSTSHMWLERTTPRKVASY